MGEYHKVKKGSLSEFGEILTSRQVREIVFSKSMLKIPSFFSGEQCFPRYNLQDQVFMELSGASIVKLNLKAILFHVLRCINSVDSSY